MAKKKTIPTLNLKPYPYSSAKMVQSFKDYVATNTNGSHYNLCDFLITRQIRPLDDIVQKLQSGASFSSSDDNNLETFTGKIDSYLNCNNFINNFKRSRINLSTLFNEIAGANDFVSFKRISTQTFTGSLKNTLPYLFSIIKHCQNPGLYPIGYKQWKNTCNQSNFSFTGSDDYDKLCDFYNNLGIPPTDIPKHLYFAAYMDYLAHQYMNIIAPKIHDYSKNELYSIFNTYKSEIDALLNPSQTKGTNTNPNTGPNIQQSGNTTLNTTPHHPLNLILYGPPGTGKTYNTLFHALAIIENKKIEDLEAECDALDQLHKNGPIANPHDGFETLKLRYDNLVKEGQIVFTTFHQSMSYEDFIEGIKPKVEGDNMTYEVQDGVFKTICNRAKTITSTIKTGKIDFRKTRVFKLSLGKKGKDADDVFQYCVDNNVIALGWGGDTDFSQCNKRSDFKKLDKTWGASAVEIFKTWMKKGDIVLISDGTKAIKGIAQLTGDYEFRDDPSIDMHQFREVKWLYAGDPIPISKLYDKNLSHQSIYGFYKKEQNGSIDNGGIKVDAINEIISGENANEEARKYVLIIDEINRGNVSQIFGELITLIEDNKRVGEGQKEAMTAILPYSQKAFGVPNNLYIIGTMNTADRSVEALDTALRRRFSFEEMMPKPSLLEEIEIDNTPISLPNLLETINKRIVVLKDREHQIGHSYFMDCPKGSNDEKKEWLANVFKDKIIPLLQEYFFGDYKKIYLVLGEGFVKKDSQKEENRIKEIFGNAIDPDDFEIDIPETYEITDFVNDFDIVDAINKLWGGKATEAPSEEKAV